MMIKKMFVYQIAIVNNLQIIHILNIMVANIV